jgi:hypothetical protein
MREPAIEVLGTSEQNWISEEDKAEQESTALYNHIGSDKE